MAVAFPVGIGLALVIGVIVNYVAAPVGNVALLSTGVVLVTLAIILDAVAYRRLPGGSAGLSGRFRGLFSGRLADSSARHPGRSDLGPGHVLQPDRFGPGRIRDFLWPGPGRNDGRGVLGSFHLAGIPHGPAGHRKAAGGDVRVFFGRPGADRHRPHGSLRLKEESRCRHEAANILTR